MFKKLLTQRVESSLHLCRKGEVVFVISSFQCPIRECSETWIDGTVDVTGMILCIKSNQLGIQVPPIPCPCFECIEEPVVGESLRGQPPLARMFAIGFIGKHKASLRIGLQRDVV